MILSSLTRDFLFYFLLQLQKKGNKFFDEKISHFSIDIKLNPHGKQRKKSIKRKIFVNHLFLSATAISAYHT